VEQLDVVLRFEGSDRTAHRRLRKRQYVGCTRHMLLLRHRHKDTKLIKRHEFQ
jgi:hypothetical protein